MAEICDWAGIESRADENFPGIFPAYKKMQEALRRLPDGSVVARELSSAIVTRGEFHANDGPGKSSRRSGRK
jgi:hypothetical protein